jgi:hypothetical protein
MSEELELTPVYFENDGPYQDAQSAEELECYVMNSTSPKTPAEWWSRGEIDRLRARIAELDAALVDVTAHLVAAVSLLERGGKKAAPSNRMFNQMIVDYKNCIERSRAALNGERG